MKKPASVVAGLIVAITMAGCASPRFGTDGYNAALVRKPDPMLPNVFVIGNKIVIDQEPVRIPAVDGRVRISWALPFGTDYVFGDGAITLIPSKDYPLPTDLSCIVEGTAKKTFTCTYTRTRPSQWKYVVRVSQGGRDLERLDPWVHQD